MKHTQCRYTGKEALCNHLRPQTHNIWKSSYSSCHSPFQSESHFKKDCFCFSANNSLKANLFLSHNGSILQHGGTGCVQKEGARHLSVLQNPTPHTTTFPTGVARSTKPMFQSMRFYGKVLFLRLFYNCSTWKSELTSYIKFLLLDFMSL